MDLDELKDRTKTVKAPTITSIGSPTSGQPVDDLIGRMKAEDAKDARMLRRMMLFFGIGGVLYVLIFTLTWLYPPDTDPQFHRVVLAAFALLFLLIGNFHRKKWRHLSGIDYTVPLRSFLEGAEKRYRFINPRDLGFMVPYLILLTVTCGLAWLSAFHRYFSAMDESVGIILFCLFMVGAGLFGFVVGKRDWQKRKAPIVEEIKRMRTELMQEETNGSKGE